MKKTPELQNIKQFDLQMHVQRRQCKLSSDVYKHRKIYIGPLNWRTNLISPWRCSLLATRNTK